MHTNKYTCTLVMGSYFTFIPQNNLNFFVATILFKSSVEMTWNYFITYWLSITCLTKTLSSEQNFFKCEIECQNFNFLFWISQNNLKKRIIYIFFYLYLFLFTWKYRYRIKWHLTKSIKPEYMKVRNIKKGRNNFLLEFLFYLRGS